MVDDVMPNNFFNIKRRHAHSAENSLIPLHLLRIIEMHLCNNLSLRNDTLLQIVLCYLANNYFRTNMGYVFSISWYMKKFSATRLIKDRLYTVEDSFLKKSFQNMI